MIIHFCALLCVASEDNVLVSCRERVMRFFDMSRERITRFLMSRESVTPFFDMLRVRIACLLCVARNGSARFVRKIFAP